MARARSFDTDEVLDQAKQVFWAKGFAATSMSDIYAATGLKPSSVYSAFKDKDGLFRAAFESYATQFNGSFPEGLSGLAAVRAWIDKQAELAYSDPDRKGCMIVNTITERLMHAPETQQMAQDRLDDITAFFRKHLDEAVAAGELEHDHPATADGLTSVVLGLMTLGRSGASKEQILSAAQLAKASLGPL